MDNYIFNAFVVPGKIEHGNLTISICFELNTNHEIFDNVLSPEKIIDWKETVLKFTKMVSFMCEDERIMLDDSALAEPIYLERKEIKIDFKEASDFWGEFLGYIYKDGVYQPRVYKIDKSEFSDEKKRKVYVLPKSLPLNIKGHAVVDKHVTEEDYLNHLNNINNSIIDQNKVINIDSIRNSIKKHPLLESIKILPKSILDGIGYAYDADVKMHKDKFESFIGSFLIDQKNHEGLSKENNEKINTLDSFIKISENIINEAPYIREAIQKLNSSLPIRRFIGTILDFSIPIDKLNPKEGFLQVKLNEKFEDDKIYNLIHNSTDFSFKTNFTRNPFLKMDTESDPVVIKGIDFNKNPKTKYNEYYENTLAKLKDKTTIIGFEPESIQRNFIQGDESIRQNSMLANLSLHRKDIDILNDSVKKDLNLSEKIDIQSIQLKYNMFGKAVSKLNNQINNLQTKGHQMIITNDDWLEYDPNKLEGKPNQERPDKQLYEHDLLNGFVIYQRIKDIKEGKEITIQNWQSLSRVNEYFGKSSSTKKFIPTDLAIDTDSFVNSLEVDSENGPKLNGINTGFMFHFDGTTVSSRNPLKHYEREYKNEKDQKLEDQLEFAERVIESSIESTALISKNKKLLTEDYFPFKKKHKSEYVLARDFIYNKGIPKLKFSNTRTYEYIMAMQYCNDFLPVNEKWLNRVTDDVLIDFKSEPAKFLRYEHIKEIIVSFKEDIYLTGTKKTKKQYVGETLTDLVIRTGNLLNNETCIRYLLPPLVPTFQTYLWYDFEKEDSFSKSRYLSSGKLFKYYNKYQCELKSVEEFQTDEPNKHTCKQNCGTYCGGTAQPQVYNGELSYLPDPIVNGYYVKFFYDKDCLQNADPTIYPSILCPIKKGNYPQLSAWKVKLVKTKPKGESFIKVKETTQTLNIYLPEGKQIFAEFWPTYHKESACFENSLINDDILKFELERNLPFNKSFSNAIVLSFTSAIQKPLFEPEILSMNFAKYKKNSINRTSTSVTARVTLKFEHLNSWDGLQVLGTQPTGELELYGLWDDYSTNKKGPQKRIDEKRTSSDTGGFVYLGKIIFKTPEDTPVSNLPKKISDSHDIASSELQAEVVFEFEPSFPIHYFTPSVFKVRNTSKFISYFEDVNVSDKDQVEKEEFSRWSKETEKPATEFNLIRYSESKGEIMASSGYLFNNQKPSAPVVEKIIPLIVRDDQKHHQSVTYYERFRIYYHPALMGKDGRLGIIIKDDITVYPTLLKGYMSHAGIDSVMDNFADRLALNENLLGRINFNINPESLEEHYVDNFDPKFDDSYSTPIQKIGLISYTPVYDSAQELWYIDIELKLKSKSGFDLHSPFVQLGLVSYQPRSANYAFHNRSVADNSEAYKDDLRLSDPIKADFFSVRPQRNFKNPFVLFKHRSVDNFSLSGALSSLYFKDDVGKKHLKSEFVLCVQKEGHGDFWDVVPSKLFKKQYKLDTMSVGVEMPEVELRYHPLLTGLESFKLSYTDQIFEVQFGIWFEKSLFRKHRVIIYEIECHNNLDLEDLPPLLINGELQRINGVNIINNFIFSREDSV